MASKVLVFGVLAALSSDTAWAAEECAAGDGQCSAGDGQSSAAAQEEETSAMLQVGTNCPEGWSYVTGTKGQCSAEENKKILQWYKGHCCVKDDFFCVSGNKNDCVPGTGLNAEVAYAGSSKCCMKKMPNGDEPTCVSGKEDDCVSEVCSKGSVESLESWQKTCYVNAFYTGNKCCVFQWGQTKQNTQYYDAPACKSQCVDQCADGSAPTFYTGKQFCTLMTTDPAL